MALKTFCYPTRIFREKCGWFIHLWLITQFDLSDLVKNYKNLQEENKFFNYATNILISQVQTFPFMPRDHFK